MPRATKSVQPTLAPQTLVVDNGAYSIKAGFATDRPQASDCRLIPNCLARDNDKRVWVGAQLDSCRDFASMAFRRPVEKGYLVRWEVEKAIWDNAFLEKGAKLQCDPHETNLVLAEAPNTPAALQKNCDEVVFEEYEFASYSRHVGSTLNAYADTPHHVGTVSQPPKSSITPAEAILVIDSGYSHTTVTPLYKGRPLQQAVRRLGIGGKVLTNYLKELVSTSFNMSDEFYMMNQAKEQVCFVSQDFREDMDRAWKGDATHPNMALDTSGKGLFVDYVLPDYSARKEGVVRPHDPVLAAKALRTQAMSGPREQIEPFLTLGNQRIKVPELLFNPGDIGMKEGGIPEVVMQSLYALPPGLWPVMLANIVVVGGTAKFEGFTERLEAEIRQMAPTECMLRVANREHPVKATWLAGAQMAADPILLKKFQVRREEYLEHGAGWLQSVFSGKEAR